MEMMNLPDVIPSDVALKIVADLNHRYYGASSFVIVSPLFPVENEASSIRTLSWFVKQINERN